MSEKDFTPALGAAQNQLELTFSASDSLDTKALGVLGFVIALSIFALQSEMHNSWWLLIPMFVMFLASTALAITVIWPRDYKGAIVNLHKHPDYLQLSQPELVLQLLADTQTAIASNSKLNYQKSFRCTLAIVSSLTGIGLLIGCIL